MLYTYANLHKWYCAVDFISDFSGIFFTQYFKCYVCCYVSISFAVSIILTFLAAAAAKSLQSLSDSVQPHRQQPTRLLRPWDSPGKNTRAGCHFPLQCMKVKSESEVTQSCPTLSDPMDCSLLGSSVHEIFQARVLEWGSIAFSVTFRSVP